MLKKLLAVLAVCFSLFVGVQTAHASTPAHPTCGDPGWNAFATYPSLMGASGVSNWYLNVASIPAGLSQDITIQHIRNAHAAWETADNWCGNPDSSSVNFTYQGNANVTAGYDHINVVKFFPLASGVVGYSYLYVNGGGRCQDLLSPCGKIVECDLALNSNVSWSNVGGAGTSDVWSVVEHEIGHCLGAGHFSSTTNDMWPYTEAPNDYSGRRLGKGDYNFVTAFY